MTRRLRAVVAVPDFVPTLGGTTRHATTHARALQAAGWDVEVLTQRRDPTWAKRETVDGIPVHRIRPARRDGIGMKAFVVGSWLWFARRRRRIDIVQVIAYPDLAIAASTAGVGRGAVICWAGDGDPTDTLVARGGRLRRLLHAVRKRLLRPVGHVALTPQLAAELAAAGIADATVIPTPVDCEWFQPPTPEERTVARAALGLADGTLAVLYLGHLRASKRVELLVEAVGLAARALPSVALFVFGDVRPELDDARPTIAAAIAALDPGIRVETGATADVRPLLHAADVLAITSEKEGLSNSVLEALACGVPVIAPPGAGGDPVVDETCGIVPPDNRPESVAPAIVELGRDPARRARLAEGARRAALHRSVPEVAAAYLALYAPRVASTHRHHFDNVR